jgi:hypothetical protein
VTQAEAERIVAIMDAIDSSGARCPRFGGPEYPGECCSGLDGCNDCLRLAAEAVVKALGL